MKFLTRQEELILLAVFRLKDNAYIVKIREFLNKHTGKDWTVGAIYVPLDRMTRTGHLYNVIGEGNLEKRGRNAIKYYRITDQGFQILEEMKSLNETMWFNVDELAYDKKE